MCLGDQPCGEDSVHSERRQGISSSDWNRRPLPTHRPEELLAVLGIVGCAGQWWSEQRVKLFQED